MAPAVRTQVHLQMDLVAVSTDGARHGFEGRIIGGYVIRVVDVGLGGSLDGMLHLDGVRHAQAPAPRPMALVFSPPCGGARYSVRSPHYKMLDVWLSN